MMEGSWSCVLPVNNEFVMLTCRLSSLANDGAIFKSRLLATSSVFYQCIYS